MHFDFGKVSSMLLDITRGMEVERCQTGRQLDEEKCV
jgi:hypothetical protein